MKTNALSIFPFAYARVVAKLPPLAGAFVLSTVWLVASTAFGQNEIKWNQPPVPANTTNVFYGWNQQSMGAHPPIAADDWVCTNNYPITKIRWWGSFLNWQSNEPPQSIQAFLIRIWDDVPKGADPNFPDFSHPGTNIQHEIFCQNFTNYFVGWDFDPRYTNYEACFVYEQTLLPDEWFYQTNGPTGTNIYWISIEALMPNTTVFWGWKTRPHDPNSLAPDDAVVFDPYVPPPGMYAPLWWPEPTNSWDLAFELISSYTNTAQKWFQPPDTYSTGWDVNDTSYGVPALARLLADDFPCTVTGPLTDISIWGSWRTNAVPPPGVVSFTLSIHKDVTNVFSMPGPVLWTNTFGPDQYQVTPWPVQDQEGFFDPGVGFWFMDHVNCFRYDFHITNNAFVQTNGNIYWLDVQAQLPPLAQAQFGWKTTLDQSRWHDAAVWANGTDQSHGAWTPLYRPQGTGQTMDLAFAVTTSQSFYQLKWSQPPVPYDPPDGYNGWNEYSVAGRTAIVADDWACTNANPVTDIHWWGSFIGWTEPNPPQMPDAFLISIWTDVPQGLEPFSHPGQVLASITCTTFTCTFAGWDFDPRNPGAPPEACFKFEQDLLPEEWFHQDPANGGNIYWVSIAAVYDTTPLYPWGWKTRPRDPDSLAPDDAVDIFNPTFPMVGSIYVGGQAIYWPDPTFSWDMAFALTTQPATDDFGDAPDPTYPTLLASNGARHTIVAGLLLGAQIDAEANGQPNATATGDDATPPPPPPGGDEDGVTLTSPIVPGGLATIQVVAVGNGFLSAWFDFNRDGSWAQAGDQIFTNLALVPGTNLLSFNVPAGASPGVNSFARFRFSTAINLTYTGQAPDGEVEDYMWYIEQLDYGDAPDPSYPTLLVNNGARHAIVPGVILGKKIDAEVNGQPNGTATGDDATPPPPPGDEDGVTLWGGRMIPGIAAGVTVSASANGFLSAWVDFNVDGSWATPGDQIFTNVWVTNGANSLTFNVPLGAARGTNTFARFRFSTIAVPTFTGLAMDGEVEDYMWKLEELDFGDAPDPTFPTLYANRGAYHWILRSPPVYMGASVDNDANGQPNADATGDDINGVPDDEDGVTLLTPLLPGQAAIAQVVAGISNGFLNAWIDFGADGSWAQPGDQIANNLMLTVAGTNLVNFLVPANAAIGSNVIARFRFSTAMNLSYTNDSTNVFNGEVEDYRWLINELDFGDAPTNYPTLLANNGARHAIFPGFALGSLEDGETDGLPNSLATGDDTNNLADEDGVVLIKPLVIGTQTCVNVTLSGTSAGKLDAWIDFNTNGSWLDAGEQVLTSAALSPGTNILCFNVPATTRPGPTFARYRLSSAGGLASTGLAADGEVEDYRVTLGWLRPSTNIVITNIVFRSMFNGWNETSVLGGTNTIAADDWVCTTTNPITDIRWWGSFQNWHATNPPALPSRFHIVFWTDVPTNAPGSPGFSHPGNRLAEIYCTNFTCQFVEWDLDPRTLAYEACFRFDQLLTPAEWFYQTNAPTGTNIFWLSIAAVYDLGVPEEAWGWKTRPRATNSLAPDDAVRFAFPNGPYQPLYWPARSNSWDLAFELVSSYTNVLEKWMRPPDLSTTGIDVNATADPMNPPPYLLADDFPCTVTGPITDIIIWGSWRNDLVPPLQFATFALSIHSDMTNTSPPFNSMPGQLLWLQMFGPGQYVDQPLPVQLEEGWLDPPVNYVYPGDHNLFQYAFHVTNNPFVQTNGMIYWLDVQAQMPPGSPFQFGWKTTPYPLNWHDDAVWVNASEPYSGTWNELRRYWDSGVSLDLAFQLITSQSFYQLKWSQPPVTTQCLTIEWNAENNVHYQVQATTNLSPTVVWTNVGPELIGPVHEQSDTDFSARAKFYIIVSPNVAP